MENTNNLLTQAEARELPRLADAAESIREAAEQKAVSAALSAEAKKRAASAEAAERLDAFRNSLRSDSNARARLAMNIFTGFNLAACVILAIVGYRMGIFTSVEALQDWVNGFGPIAPIIFIIFQAVQVVIPIIPGGISLAGGVVIFGPWWGFVYNYLGICLGSMAAFAVSRNFGKPLMYKLFPEKAVAKYEKFTNDRHRFTKMFAIAIFAPCAPDDMLCYLAGTTDMSWKTYALIILLGKPASTAMYSIGLMAALRALASLL